MLLAEQGRLRLDDDIRKHLPEFPQYNAERPIVIEDLLTMRSGLKEYPMDEPSVTRKNLTAWYATQDLEAPTAPIRLSPCSRPGAFRLPGAGTARKRCAGGQPRRSSRRASGRVGAP